MSRRRKINWNRYTGTFYVRGETACGAVELERGLIRDAPPIWKRFILNRFDSLIRDILKRDQQAMWTKLHVEINQH